MNKSLISLSLIGLAALTGASTLETVNVPSPSLTGVPVESTSREALIYLPDGYQGGNDQYPVLYVLHGYGGDATGWFTDELNLQRSMDELVAAGKIDDMVVVVPSTFTINYAAWYQPSAITGDWRSFMLDDLSDYVESHYRIDGQQAILGHSMGAYGAVDLALHEQFTSVAAMSPPGYMLRPLPTEFSVQNHNNNIAALENYNGELDQLEYMQHIYVALSQLITPAPSNPPHYFNKQPSWQQFKRFSDLALMNKVRIDHAGLTNTPVRLEIGRAEGMPVVEEVMELTEQLTNFDIDAELHIFEGGHTDKMHITLRDNLIFVDSHWD